jgi:alpha-galactosidase
VASPLAAAQISAPLNLAPTPPMGWASWNPFFCDYDAQTIRAQADALVSTGMRDLGYKYVLIQECIAPSRDAKGNLVVDPKRFPHGIGPLVDYIHSLDLKAGIYTDVGPYTCYNHPGKPRYMGSFGHEEQDAKTFASWGIDFVEMDYCNKPSGHTGKEIYTRMSAALRATGRPMVFYICSWGKEQPWEWAQGVAELWRTTGDISNVKDHADWNDVVRNFELNAQHSVFAAPNSWNDPDMLEVGNRSLTAREGRSHFSMWAISAAPLWAGTDLTRMNAATRATLTNHEAIAVDQDPLGAGPVRISGSGRTGAQVWAKPLGARTSGVDAVLLLNLTSSPKKISIRWSDLGLLPNAKVRDLWAHKELGTFANEYSATIPSHGSKLLKVSGEFNWKQGGVFEAEWPGNARRGETKLVECSGCSQGFAIGLEGESSGNAGSLEFRKLWVPEAGTYTVRVTVAPATSANANLQVQTNDVSAVPAKQMREANGRITFPVALHSGDNTLTVTNLGSSPAKIDKIRLLQ